MYFTQILHVHFYFLQNGKYSFCQIRFRVALAGSDGTHWLLQLLACRLQPLGADSTVCRQSNHSSKVTSKIKTLSEAHFTDFFHRDAHSNFVLLSPTSSWVVITKFCTRHDSFAVMTWAIICSDLVVTNGITTKRNFYRIVMGGKIIIQWAFGTKLSETRRSALYSAWLFVQSHASSNCHST